MNDLTDLDDINFRLECLRLARGWAGSTITPPATATDVIIEIAEKYAAFIFDR